MKHWTLFLALLAASCGSPEPPPATKPAMPPTPPKAESPAQGVYAEMKTVDYEGKPLSGMVPIATLSANAFDEPVARGSVTNEKGFATITLPQETRLFLRAWDPQMRMFAHNFYEMPAMKGNRTESMTVMMVPAAAVAAALQDSEGKPLADTDVNLLLIHAQRGPWWPARAKTDSTGAARFSPVPPGDYVLEFDASGHGKARTAETFLAPTQTNAVGLIQLTLSN